MKKLLGIVIVFCLMSVSASAQSVKSTKIYFFNAVINLGTTDLKLMTGENKTIPVKQRNWVILEIPDDSLGFFVRDKPYFIHLEPGKSYYFMAEGNYRSLPEIVEKSEREFFMSISINSAKGPEEYKLGKLAN